MTFQSAGFVRDSTTGALIVSQTNAVPATNVTDATYGADPTGVADSSAPVSAAVSSTNGLGDVYLPAGTYLWNAAPVALPTGAAGLRIHGAGVGATVIKLTQNALRAFDCTQGLSTTVTGSTTNTSTTVTGITGSQAGITNGMNLSGTGIPAGTTLSAGAGTSTWTLSLAATATGTPTIQVYSYDTFQNIEISDLTVDANNTTTNVNQHVLFGNLIGGNWTRYATFKNIRILRCKTVNVISDSTASRQNVSMSSLHLATAEATQTSVQNVLVEDCDFSGGWVGVALLGGGGGASGANVFLDRLFCHRVSHDTLNVQATTFSSANFQLGGSGFIGYCELVGCIGNGSGDVGVEIDSPTYALVERCRMTDARNANFFVRNFHTPQLSTGGGTINAQRVVFRDSHARVIAQNAGTGGVTSYGWQLSNTGAPTFGTVVIDGCSLTYEAQGMTVTSGQAIWCSGVAVTRTILRDFHVAADNIADTSVGSPAWRLIYYHPSSNSSLIAENVTMLLSGSTTNATLTQVLFDVAAGAAAIDVQFALDGYEVYNGITGLANFSSNVLRVADGVSTGTLHGSVKRLKILSYPANQRLVWVQSVASGHAITPALRFEDCDFTKAGAGDAEFFFNGTDNAQMAAMPRRRITYLTSPRATVSPATSNFATATFTSGVGNQYIGGDPADIQFQTATGAALTTIDVSKDNVTYENAYTQGSGALANSVMVPVDNGDYVKITATTMPTIKVRFRK